VRHGPFGQHTALRERSGLADGSTTFVA